MRVDQFTALAATLSITTVSITASADPPVRDVETYEESVPNRGLIVSGAVLLGATYGASAVVAATSDRSADKALYVPVAGPWIDLADRSEGSGGDTEVTNKVLLIADGIGQGIGALQIVSGFLFPAKRVVTNVGEPTLRVTPNIGRAQYGLTAYGTF